jgi:dTDP-4-dehydrorhamnose 3,5-epimerase
MIVTKTSLDGVLMLSPKKHGDHRGFFSETYNKKTLAEAGIDLDFVQDNHSLSVEVGVVRGLHFQSPPYSQCKLIRVVKGKILDVAVDLRRSSPTFKQHVAVELSEEAWNQLLVPVGFAHGFVTLAPNTEVVYKVTNYYSQAHDLGVRWNDPSLNIPWPVTDDTAILSPKDKALPLVDQVAELF